MLCSERRPGERIRLAAIVVFAVALGGCAGTAEEPGDPLEGFNRGVYAFNKGLDRAVVKPTTRLYRAVTPDPIETAVSSFFANIGDAISAVNSLLQFKITDAAESGARVAINSTMGLLGLIDLASGLGIERHDEDFGQTLGRWGLDSGPYLVLPVLGPSSLRDAPGRAVDTLFFDPVFALDDVGARNALIAGRAVDTRAGLLRAERVLESAALDEYSFVRDAYLQRRRHLVNDGDR